MLSEILRSSCCFNRIGERIYAMYEFKNLPTNAFWDTYHWVVFIGTDHGMKEFKTFQLKNIYFVPEFLQKARFLY